ncbi:hypothetical protein REPUB_Repub19eG0042700 [Reevesia pubescens]
MLGNLHQLAIGPVDSTLAELLAIKEAMVIFVASKWVKTHGLCIESDNQSVVKWVSCPEDTPWKLRKFMSTVEALKLELISWEVSLTPRVNNVTADGLVKFGPPLPNMPLYVPKSINITLNEEQLKVVFKEHDINGDGRLSKEELLKAFQKLGSRNPSWRVHRSLHHADSNGDGSISLDELDELVRYAIKLGYGVK